MVKRSYSMKTKRLALVKLRVGRTLASVAREIDLPESTLRDWRGQAAAIMANVGSDRSKSLKGQGRKEIIPFSHELVVFMKDKRRDEEVLSSLHLIDYRKDNYGEWLDNYLAAKKNPNNSLMRLCQRFARRHGFSRRTPTFTKEPTVDLIATRDAFATKFWNDYSAFKLSEIFNVDETAVYFESPPTRIWALRGGSARVKKTQKTFGPAHRSYDYELPTYPKGHYYAVQENAWMDSTAWKAYVLECFRYELDGPAFVLVDNFDAHVSDEGVAPVAEQACCEVVPLPPNSTSVCQPLDVGVMGPLKAKLRTFWLTEKGKAKTAAEKRIAMIKRTIAAWDAISEDTVAKSFVKALPKTVEEEPLLEFVV